MVAYRKEVAMSKIKEAKRSILQIMPAEGWVAVFQDEDGELSERLSGNECLINQSLRSL
jgi:hypothetical protein